MTNTFNLKLLLQNVFEPQPDERVLMLMDTPTADIPDHPDWQSRRTMAREWLDGFVQLGLSGHVLSFPATGANNADLPREAVDESGAPSSLAEAIAQADIVLAFTTFSATAPLSAFVKAQPGLRVASLPGVLKIMEDSALAADYTEVARKANVMAPLLTEAHRATVRFKTGHELIFDLRHRRGLADDGRCTSDKSFPLINLPSGEAFIVPYEGEQEGIPSQTSGKAPMMWEGQLVVAHIEQNRIVRFSGPGAEAAEAYFAVDATRRNIAELGLGCNDKALIRGIVLEDEKAGFHWAYGRSEHLGGTIGPDAFKDAGTVVHKDIVYAPGCPIEVDSVCLHVVDKPDLILIEGGKLLV